MRLSTSFKVCLMGGLMVILLGCSNQKGWFRDRSEDYGKAVSYPTLTIPTNTHAESFSEEYQIPDDHKKDR